MPARHHAATPAARLRASDAAPKRPRRKADTPRRGLLRPAVRAGGFRPPWIRNTPRSRRGRRHATPASISTTPKDTNGHGGLKDSSPGGGYYKRTHQKLKGAAEPGLNILAGRSPPRCLR